MRPALALAVVFVCYVVAGTLDYADRQALAEHRRAVQMSRPAPVWSKRCEKAGQDALVKQADGGRPTIHCVPRRVLTVGA